MGRGEWRAALRAAVDSAEQKVDLGDLVTLAQSLDLSAVSLCALRCFEAAAVITGTTNALAPHRAPPAWAAELMTAAGTAVVEALGEQPRAALEARGAALEVGDAVAYLRAQSDVVLSD